MGLLDSLFGGGNDQPAGPQNTSDPSQMDPEALELWMLNQMADHNEEFGEPILADRIARQYGIRYDESHGGYRADPEAAANSRFNPDGSVNYNSGQGTAGQAEQPVAAAYDSQRGAVDPNYRAADGPVAGNTEQAMAESQAGAQHLQGQFENAHVEARNLAGLASNAQQQSLRNIGQESAYQSDRANQQAAASFARGTTNRGIAGSILGAGAVLGANAFGQSGASASQPGSYGITPSAPTSYAPGQSPDDQYARPY